MSELNDTLRQFDAVEANLAKLEAAWNRMNRLLPKGVALASSSPEAREYLELRRAFEHLLDGLPAIDRWRITALPAALDEIAQWRFDANEVGEPAAWLAVERQIEEPGEQIDEYRSKMMRLRRELVRARQEQLVEEGDAILAGFAEPVPTTEGHLSMRGPDWERLESVVSEVDRLLGSGTRSAHWKNLRRHLGFAQSCDLHDIRDRDWPAVKAEIAERAFDQLEPIPVDVPDLAKLVAAAPSGRASTALNWSAVDEERFGG